MGMQLMRPGMCGSASVISGGVTGICGAGQGYVAALNECMLGPVEDVLSPTYMRLRQLIDAHVRTPAAQRGCFTLGAPPRTVHMTSCGLGQCWCWKRKAVFMLESRRPVSRSVGRYQEGAAAAGAWREGRNHSSRCLPSLRLT